MRKILLVFSLMLPVLFGSAQSVTGVLYPRYVQGVGSGVPSGDRKVPYACRMTVTGLTAGVTYRYYSRFVFDPADQTNGTGSYILVNQAGNFVRITSASLGTPGSYGEFVTDASGSYTGWFIVEPTSDPLFQPGTELYWRIMLNDGAGGSTVVHRVTAANPVIVLNWGTAQTTGGFVNGSALWGATNPAFIPKNFVMLYDNIAGTGRPVSGTFIEADGTANTIANGYTPFYQTLVNEVNNRWGTIIPNNLANGINKISQHALSNGSLLNSCTSPDGVYSSINQSGFVGTTDTKNTNWGLTVSFTSTTPRNVNCTPGSACNITLSNTITNVSCNGGNNGAINLTVTGATLPITYNWSNGATTEDINGLAAGSYTVNLTDANNCTATATITVAQPPTAVTANAVATAATCGNANGSINLTVSGGIPPYTFLWSNGATTEDINGLTAGTYNVTVTDANGCTATANATVNGAGGPAITVANTTNVLCFGQNTGSIDITASGGTAPYTFLWSNGATTEDISGLAAGIYSITVTDANNCSTTLGITITQPAQLTASSSAPPITTVGGNTTVTVTASGGTPPYTGTGTFVRNAGAYTFIVTDANGCTASTTITLTEPGCNISLATAVTNITCFGGSTGAINLTVNGAVAPLSYNWSNGATTEDISGLTAGTYTVTVTDAVNCAATTTATILQPEELVASETHTAIACFGGASTVTISATGGSAPYTGTGTFTQSAGTQSYTVTDANGCTDAVTVTLVQPAELTASETHTSITCFGGLSTVTVTATGGSAPYTGTGIFTQSAGTQSYTVTDANGCIDVVTLTITQPAELAASEAHTSIACFGGISTVTVTATGGSVPYTGTGIFTQSAGTQSYTVTDANGCTDVVTVTVVQPAQLAISETHTAASCVNGASTVTISATGGTLPYTGTGNFTQAMSSQTYTVSDANGCSSAITVTLPQPAPSLVAASAAGTIMFYGGTTRVTVTATGGTPPYTGTGIFIVSAGPYSYTVTDSKGCTSTTSGVVVQPPPPASLTLTINPNPGPGYLNLVVSSNDNNSPVTIRVMDALGRVIWKRHNADLNQPLRVGETWSAGIYFAEAIQGTQRKTVRVVKMN